MSVKSVTAARPARGKPFAKGSYRITATVGGTRDVHVPRQ